MKISIIIPAFNEEKIIGSTLSSIEFYMDQYTQCNWWEVLVVNDGSTDNTLSVLACLKNEKAWLKILSLPVNTGRGAALRKGFAHAEGEFIVSLDADLSYAPYHIGRMMDKLIDEKADMVLASAYCSEGSVKNVPVNRLIISKLGNKILSYMYGENVTVLSCIVRAYTKSFVQSLDLHSNDKNIHLEILYKAKILGATIVEVPADLAWAPYKKVGEGAGEKRRSTLKLRKTSRSHFFFALINKPGVVFTLPGIGLLLLSIGIISICFYSMIPDIENGMSTFMALRKSMVETATPSWMVATFFFSLSIQFFSLGFLTNQSKWNYEETYRTNNAILSYLKKNK